MGVTSSTCSRIGQAWAVEGTPSLWTLKERLASQQGLGELLQVFKGASSRSGRIDASDEMVLAQQVSFSVVTLGFLTLFLNVGIV